MKLHLSTFYVYVYNYKCNIVLSLTFFLSSFRFVFANIYIAHTLIFIPDVLEQIAKNPALLH